MKYIAIILIMLSINKIFAMPEGDPPDVRPASLAGIFYPEEPGKLSGMISQFIDFDLDEVAPNFDPPDDIHAIVVPHAGYVFSGWIAAMSYKFLEGRHYDAVIVIAPSHQEYFKGAAIYPGSALATPLGEVAIDKELALAIAGNSEMIELSAKGHMFGKKKAEHSLEVQLPFIKTVLPDSKIVPISMGSQDFTTAHELVRSIYSAINETDKQVLIVASSDLSHFHSDQEARKIDLPLAAAFAEFDYYKIASNCFMKKWEACGAGPIFVAMSLGELLGSNKTKLLKYANSSETSYYKTNNKNRVVGYLTGLVYNDDSDKQYLLPDINEEEKQVLLENAWNAVKNKVNPGSKFEYISSDAGNKEYAAFVTLKKGGALRGCMGHTFATTSLHESIIDAAEMASVKDPRFPKVDSTELDSLSLSITVLSRMKKILDFNEIEPGRDGVFIRFGNKSALFLPQVALEQNWTNEVQLEYLCKKAGLPMDFYLNKNAELFVFRAMTIE
jgi:AmmeMemoRadiSam system protein B/AmmeMemoRadiSam system protein A